jgi:hypothetical protein
MDLITLLIDIIGWACLAHLLVDFLQTLDIPIIQRKPFTCDMCMGFWIGVPHAWAAYGFIHGTLVAAITGVVADLIFRWKLRL